MKPKEGLERTKIRGIIKALVLTKLSMWDNKIGLNKVIDNYTDKIMKVKGKRDGM